jgi:hypothetical protein
MEDRLRNELELPRLTSMHTFVTWWKQAAPVVSLMISCFKTVKNTMTLINLIKLNINYK